VWNVPETIWVGCCGFPCAQARYWELFDAVEVQQTFYRLPRASTAARWRQQAPAGARLFLKVWQLVTHPPSSPTYRRLDWSVPRERWDRYGLLRPTPEVRDAWRRFLEIALAAEPDGLLLQTPPSFDGRPPHPEHLRAFLASLEARPAPLLWEPRGSWERSLVETLCRELDLVHVVDPFQDAPTHAPFHYYRLHGIGGPSYRFSDADLQTLKGLCPRDRETFCLFNNVAMLGDARRFRALVRPEDPGGP
jgi:uncharacterized protein YecE (DUF72 family)